MVFFNRRERKHPHCNPPGMFFFLEMSSSNFHILRMPLMTIKILVLLLLIKCDLYLKNNENYLWVWLPVPFRAKCVLYLWESSRLTTEVSYFPQKSWSFLNCLLIVFSWAFLGRNMSPKSSVSLRAKRDQKPCAVDVRTLRLDDWHWIIYQNIE